MVMLIVSFRSPTTLLQIKPILTSMSAFASYEASNLGFLFRSYRLLDSDFCSKAYSCVPLWLVRIDHDCST